MRNLVVGCICMLFISSLGTAQADYKEIKYSGETEGKKSLKMAKENQLMHAYDVKFYKLDLEVDDESVFISGEVSILLEVTDNSISTLVFQLLNQLDIESVFIDDQELNFTHQDNEITISLDSPASAGSLLTARVKYSGYAGGGLFTGVDSRYLPFPITATLSEPFYAKDWFPCKEVLGDKADSVHVFITTEYGLKGVSNGMNTGTTYLPNGKIRHEWKSNYPIAYYLISIAVSDYMEYNIVANPKGSTEPLLIQNFLYNDEYYLNRYKAEIDETIDIMELFAELFGPYPFQDEKYGHYLWPWGGGMEHQTMTGMGNFNFGLNAHELGHSWFGNYVTCATWQDIWINEGFASYAAYLATENLRPGQASTELISSFESAMREPNGSVFVPESGANSDSRIFSGSLSYRKGMALVHMIRYELQDDELFFSILKNFTQQYAFSVARGVDFQAVLEAESGMDFTDFFDQWYFGFGFPSFSLMWEQSGSTVTLYSKQTTSSTMTPLFKTPLEFKLYYDGGDTIVSGYHNTNDEIFVFNIDETIENIAIDPDNWLLNGFDGVQELVGIEKNQSLFRLYPNPNEGVFSFTVPEEAGNELKLEVFNSINQLVYSESIKDFAPNSDYTVDLDSPRSGIYFIRFSSKTYVETKRILIK